MAELRSFAKLSIGTDVGAPSTLDAPGADTFNEIIDVLNISGPNTSKGDIEVTNLQSSAKEYISDLPDPGELTFTLSRDDADTYHNTLQGDANVVNRFRNYRLEWEDASGPSVVRTADFVAECMEYSAEESPGAQKQANVRLKLTGSITYS